MTPADITGVMMEMLRYTKKSADTALIGRFVRVISDRNGQPYGRSAKSWKGQLCRIKSVHIDLDTGILLCLEGHGYECFIGADEVEFP